MPVQRGFSGETDVQAMIALAHLAPSDNLHVADLPYRISSWALDEPDNFGLWFDSEGALIGWAVMQTPFWTIDYVYDHRAMVTWFDANPGASPCGQIEPTGVHEDFRNLGLGRAILLEGLRRLYQRGAESVYVETDLDRRAAMGLYEAVGFQPARDVLVYRKDYGEFGD